MKNPTLSWHVSPEGKKRRRKEGKKERRKEEKKERREEGKKERIETLTEGKN